MFFLSIFDTMLLFLICFDILVDIEILFYLRQSKTSGQIRLHVYVVDLMIFTRQL